MIAPQLPDARDADVTEWLITNSMTGSPGIVPYQNEGYQARFCHVSSQHHTKISGGHRVHGWALWRFTDAAGDTIIIAEHHSVWQRPDGKLVDVTPPASGGSETLFLRDDSAVIEQSGDHFLLRTDRTNFPDMPRMFRGKPVQQEFWKLSVKDQPEAAEYASSLGFDWADFPTASSGG